LLIASIVLCFTQVRAAEAVAKLRTSVGLRVDRVLGPGVYNAVEGEAALCGTPPPLRVTHCASFLLSHLWMYAF
jgi:hypothetical protein